MLVRRVFLPLLAMMIVSGSAFAAASDRKPPTVPTGLTAAGVGCSQVNLSWLPSTDSRSGVAGYRVYRNGLMIGATTGTSYSDTSVPEAVYSYQVSAYDNSGNESGLSDPASATMQGCIDVEPPAAPPSLSATVIDCRQVRLSWNPSTDTGGAGTAGYYVHGLILTAGQSFTHTGATPSSSRTYLVSAFDANGNMSSASQASVNTPGCNVLPVASAGADQTGVVGVPVTWNGSGSFDPDGIIVSYQWSFGDWTAGSGQTASHTYSQPGVYRAILTVYDDTGAASGDFAFVEIAEQQTNLPPVADAGADQTVDAGTSVTLDGSGSTDPDGAIVSYQWSFGDGGSATGQTVSHTYSQPGTYNVLLTVYDDAAAGNSDIASVVVEEPGNSAGGETIWSKALGGSAWEAGVAAMVDSGDGILLAGKFSDFTNLGGSNLTSAGSTDIFLAEYTQSGTHVWSRAIGGSGGETAMDMALDPSGDPIIAGSFSGTTNFGDGPAQAMGSVDIFVVKYSGGSNSNPAWSRRFGSPGTVAYAFGVAADFRGDILVTGSFMGTIDFDGIALTSTSSNDTFVAKLSGNTGATMWAQSFPSLGDDSGKDVAVDGNGDLYVTGNFKSMIFFDETKTSAGLADIFLVRLDGVFGDVLWSRHFGGTGDDIGLCVTVDAQDNAVFTATYERSTDFGGVELISAGRFDMALVKYSSLGAHQWSQTLGGSGNLATPTALTVDPAGDVLLAGHFEFDTNLGGQTFTSAGGRDMFVAKYASGSGAHLWSRAFGGVANEYSGGIVTDGNGYILVNGLFRETIDFGDNLRTSAGSADAFLLRLAP